MDNFMDKLAQKFTAQEMIKANSAADAAELERLQKQLAQYDACLQEMRKLSLKNSEAMDQLQSLICKSEEKLAEYQTAEGQYAAFQNQFESLQKLCEEIRTVIQDMDRDVDFDPLIDKIDDFVHKENVKVYRNVQAVVVEEMEKQAENSKKTGKKAAKKQNAVLVFAILTFLGVLADVAVTLLIHFQIF